MINRLRQYILDRRFSHIDLIGSSMGGLVGLNYAHRYGGVGRLLLLAPALVYLSGERAGIPLAQWRQQGVDEVFHYGFNQKVPLRLCLEVDGHSYHSPPPAPITIVHGVHDEVVLIAGSREYAARYPEWVHLIEVAAGHDIKSHLDLVWEAAQRFFLKR